MARAKHCGILDALAEAVTDKEFEDKTRKYVEEDGVILRSKEQLLYYEVY